MAEASRVEVFDVPAQKLFQAIVDYESYPEFVDGTQNAKIVAKKADYVDVQFGINIIKKFQYTLRLKESAPFAVHWSFLDGELFEKNNGSWLLKDLGNGKTEVTYSLDIEFKIKVPGMILKKLTSSNLPSMMKSFYQRAKSL